MKKLFPKFYFLILALLLTITGITVYAQKLEYPSAKNIVKEVLWEMAKDAGHVATKKVPYAAIALDVMEMLTLDQQMYGDVARGVYWVSRVNQKYEYNWGERVVYPPKGVELYDLYLDMKKSGFISKDEKRNTTYDMQKTPIKKWHINNLPKSVQDKINAILKVSVSPDRTKIIENAVSKAKDKAMKTKNRSTNDIISVKVPRMKIAQGQTVTKNFAFGSVFSNRTVQISFLSQTFGSWDVVGKNKDSLIVKINNQIVLNTSRKGSVAFSKTVKLNSDGQVIIRFIANATGEDEGLYIKNLVIRDNN